MAKAVEWAAAMGQSWAARAEAMDRQLAPTAPMALAALAPMPGERILDLGCGPGATTVLLAEAVGPEGHVTGLDISPDLLAIARARLAGRPQAVLVEADAQTHAHEGAPFDALFSRLGAMFFADPEAALANLHVMLRPDARAVFLVFDDISRNPWAGLPVAVGNAVLGPAPRPPPGAPGPFGWSDPAYFEPLLAAGGFRDIAWEARDLVFEVGEGSDPDAIARAVALMVKIGPLARRLTEMPERAADVRAELARRLAPHAGSDWVRLDARVWIITARA